MNRDDFFEQVNLALDDRRDPIDDVRVRAWLIEHPEDFEALERLRTTLDHLASTSHPRTPDLIRRVASIAALVVATASVSLLAWKGVRTEPVGSPQAAAHIYHFRISVVTETPTGRTVTTSTPSGRTVRSVDRSNKDAETDTRVVIFNTERVEP